MDIISRKSLPGAAGPENPGAAGNFVEGALHSKCFFTALPELIIDQLGQLLGNWCFAVMNTARVQSTLRIASKSFAKVRLEHEANQS